MKKLLVAIVLMLGMWISVSAQFIDSYGLKAGIVLANQDVAFTPLDAELPTDILPGPGAGIFVEMFKGKKLSLQLEAGYRSKGHRTTAQSLTVDHLNNDSIIVNHGPLLRSGFDYLKISPLLRIRAEIGSVHVYTLLGPGMEFLLAYNSTSPWPLPDQNKMLVGLNGAVGGEYALQNFSLFAEIAYEVDIMPVYNITPLWVSNNALFFSVGIRR